MALYLRLGVIAAVAFAVALGSVAAEQSERKAQTPSAEKTQTKVVLLGTGTPRPYPDRSGPATAIVVGGRAYLVDFGPGVMRRAAYEIPEHHTMHWMILLLADRVDSIEHRVLRILPFALPLAVAGAAALAVTRRRRRRSWF